MFFDSKEKLKMQAETVFRVIQTDKETAMIALAKRIKQQRNGDALERAANFAGGVFTIGGVLGTGAWFGAGALGVAAAGATAVFVAPALTVTAITLGIAGYIAYPKILEKAAKKLTPELYQKYEDKINNKCFDKAEKLISDIEFKIKVAFYKEDYKTAAKLGKKLSNMGFEEQVKMAKQEREAFLQDRANFLRDKLDLGSKKTQSPQSTVNSNNNSNSKVEPTITPATPNPTPSINPSINKSVPIVPDNVPPVNIPPKKPKI